ncbi:hypothetical protein NM688_g2127 [Phlebia brevispora]|uniref:Uncharacterized protein n=1 Tax=Phlebia brevispora TaxID=194682 RepID=A0ACC1T9S6_9APHY|nr:hypothetical protein NM688_g2127 [Phlebia brevispora]
MDIRSTGVVLSMFSHAATTPDKGLPRKCRIKNASYDFLLRCRLGLPANLACMTGARTLLASTDSLILYLPFRRLSFSGFPVNCYAYARPSDMSMSQHSRETDSAGIARTFLPASASVAYNSGLAALSDFNREGNMQHLDKAVEKLTEGITLRSTLHGRDGAEDFGDACWIWRMTCGSALMVRYTTLWCLEDLDAASEQLKEAARTCPSSEPRRVAVLGALGDNLKTSFDIRRDPNVLAATIDIQRELLTLTPSFLPQRAAALKTLALCLQARYDLENIQEDQEASIELFREALAVDPENANHWMARNCLGRALLERGQRLTAIQDLNEAVALQREAERSCPPPSMVQCLRDLADTLVARFKQTKGMRDLDEAIQIYRKALDSIAQLPTTSGFYGDYAWCPLEMAASSDAQNHDSSRRQRLSLLPNLSQALAARFNVLGKFEDVDEMIRVAHESMEIPSEDAIVLASSQLQLDAEIPWTNFASLSMAFGIRFSFSGDIKDLDKAVLWREKSLERCLSDEDLCENLHSLGHTLSLRYRQTHVEGDIAESIRQHRSGLALRSAGHPKLWLSLQDLGVALISTNNVALQLREIDEAIACFRQATNILPQSHDDHARGTLRHNLAYALQTRARRLGNIDELDESIQMHEEAVSFLRPTDPLEAADLCVVPHNAALAHVWRYKHSPVQSPDDLKIAIEYEEEALKRVPSNHHLYSRILRGLADVCLLQSPWSRDPFQYFERAVASQASPARLRLEVAIDWVRHAREVHHPSALDGYRQLLSLLDRCLMLYTTIESQHNFLVKLPRDLSSDACATALEAGEIETAVELLEQGRGLLWGRLTRFRHPLEALREIDAALANEFETSSKDLEELTIASSASDLLLSRSNDATTMLIEPETDPNARLHMVSERWEQSVNQIRQIEGFSSFLKTVTFSELRHAAADGPVIVVNVCNCRSDAIIVRYSQPPIPVPLPRAKLERIMNVAQRLSDTLSMLHGNAAARRRMLPSGQRGSDDEIQDPHEDVGIRSSSSSTPIPSKRMHVEIKKILQILWEDIVEPIACQLKDLGVKLKSRIWWYPTSVLWRLPLHAAGPYISAKDEPTFHDLYVSSYMPTFTRALLSRSVAQKSAQAFPPSLLVVGVPGDPGQDTFLPEVEEELCRIIDLSKQRLSSLHLLLSENATAEAIQQDLPTHAWAHLTCHGYQNPEPFNSYFELHNSKRISLKDIMQSNLPRAELAFLSACNTATGDQVFDEVIHLAAAMQFCGFHSVIGTMWPMVDEDGPEITGAFYHYMFSAPNGSVDFRNSAEALHHAVECLRQKKGVTIDRWIAFVHYGL